MPTDRIRLTLQPRGDQVARPSSPLHLSRLPAGMIPLVQFAERCPVYFDRHTFSLKDGRISMFTMDGRMRFQGNFGANEQAHFVAESQKLREVVLLRSLRGEFSLHFHFQDVNTPTDPLDWPTYVLVDVLAGKLNDNDPQAVIHGGEDGVDGASPTMAPEEVTP
ncbi:MAG: hypothetical protein EBV34_08895 [Betaproteobacteria bacterium]|nr:hypothetical protein [Betaproteobacteria bacterium]